MRKSTLIIFFILAVVSKLYSAENEKKSNLLPKQGVIQYAGNLGLISIGLGNKIINGNAFVGLLYGYLPKSQNDVEAHTLAAKFKWNIKNTEKYTLYCGTGFTYTITKNTFAKLPDHYPEGYYKPNAFHLLPFVGTSLEFKKSSESKKYIGVYLEIGSVDDYLYNYLIKNSRNKDSILNLAVGVIVDI